MTTQRPSGHLHQLGFWGLGLSALVGCALLGRSAAADIAPRPPAHVAPARNGSKPVFHGDLSKLKPAPSASAEASTSGVPSASAEAPASAAPIASESSPASDGAARSPEEAQPAPSAAIPAAGQVADNPGEPPKAHAGGPDVRAARASFIVAAAFLGVLAAFWMLMRWRKSRLYAKIAAMEAAEEADQSSAET